MWNETFLNSEKRKENGSKMEIRLSLVSLSWAVYLLEAGIYFCLMFLSLTFLILLVVLTSWVIMVGSN